MFDKVLGLAKDAVAQGQVLASKATEVGKEKLGELQERLEAGDKLAAIQKFIEVELDSTDSEEVVEFAQKLLKLIKD